MGSRYWVGRSKFRIFAKSTVVIVAVGGGSDFDSRLAVVIA